MLCYFLRFHVLLVIPVAHIFRVIDSKLGIVVHALSPQHMIFVYIIAIACNHLIRNIIIRNVKIFRLVQQRHICCIKFLLFLIFCILFGFFFCFFFLRFFLLFVQIVCRLFQVLCFRKYIFPKLYFTDILPVTKFQGIIAVDLF